MDGQIGIAGLHGCLESRGKPFGETIGGGVVWCRAETLDAVSLPKVPELFTAELWSVVFRELLRSPMMCEQRTEMLNGLLRSGPAYSHDFGSHSVGVNYYPGQKTEPSGKLIKPKHCSDHLILHDLPWYAQAMSRSNARLALTARSLHCSGATCRRGGAWLERRCNNHVQRLQAKVWKWRLRHDRSWKHENKQTCWQWHFGRLRLCGGLEKNQWKKKTGSRAWRTSNFTDEQEQTH